jgi:hypothetical protein
VLQSHKEPELAADEAPVVGGGRMGKDSEGVDAGEGVDSLARAGRKHQSSRKKAARVVVTGASID